MAGKNATIHDVAERAGVSIGTVSAVINRKSTVSQHTRRKVLQAVSDLNYRPSAAARRRLQPTAEKSVGLVVKEINNPYFADIIVGAQMAAKERGYNLLVTHTERSYDLERELVELLVAKDVDGLIVNPLLDDNADLSHLFELKRHNIPLVLIESVRGLQANMVDVDNVAASKSAVEYLIENGHTHIAHFTGPKYSMHSAERVEGVRRAFSSQRLIFDEDDIVAAGARIDDGYTAAHHYFGERGKRPTAVTCYNDLVAIGVYRALRELGLSVPDDVSVVGYDDIDIAQYASVPLTTVRVPKREMGGRAAELLINSIESAGDGEYERVFLETKLVVRESTTRVRQEA